MYGDAGNLEYLAAEVFRKTTVAVKANTHKDNKKSLRATTGSSHLTVAGLTVYL